MNDDKVKAKKNLHIAFTTKSTIKWAILNGKSFEEAFKKKLDKIVEMTQLLINKDIPIISFYLIGEKLRDKYFFEIIDLLEKFFNTLPTLNLIKENNVKISVIGKWYNLPDRLKDAIKKSMELTSENQSYYLNLFVHYDGYEEILDAVKSIMTLVIKGRFDVESLTPMLIKEHLYTSYFIPPDVIFTNINYKTSGFLLWDSRYSKIINIKKLWPDIKKEDVLKHI